jgi:hypothetical protein
MRKSLMPLASLFLFLPSSPRLLARDNLSSAIKQLLGHRANDFASIRKDPHPVAGDTVYASAISVPGASGCYISREVKPWYTDNCDVFETQDRAALDAKYKEYVRALRDAAPAPWENWTEQGTPPGGEYTYIGPDRSHPAAAVHWSVEGMNKNWYALSVTFYPEGYVQKK